jgi:hypothetical protein
MKEKEEFFVPYINGSLGKRTKNTLKLFSFGILTIVAIVALAFSFSQDEFKNSSFELSTETKIVGIYHESPYPMLKVKLAENEFKNIVLLGFGKSGVNPYLDEIRKNNTNIEGMTLSIEGNLIYYNGKTLIQVTSDEKVKIVSQQKSRITKAKKIKESTFIGEIVDPKCYFGVMKPGKGKIHRSCAVLCIAGGIPPVFATTDNNKISKYFLITDLKGNPINDKILEYVGKPSRITGKVEKFEDWHLLKVDTSKIVDLDKPSSVY